MTVAANPSTSSRAVSVAAETPHGRPDERGVTVMFVSVSVMDQTVSTVG